MARGLIVGALVALAAVSVSGADNVATQTYNAPATGNVYLPTTPNDFGTMIFTLLESQVKHLATQEGVETDGSPANLMATMAHYLMQAQQAFFKEAAPLTQSQLAVLEGNTSATAGTQFDNIVANHNITFPFPNQTFPNAITNPNFTAPAFLKNLPDPPIINYNGLFTNISQQLGISNRTDPISQDLFNLIVQDPAGPELNGAFQALPNIPDPLSFGTANFSGGAYGTGVNGTRTFVSLASTLLSYRPCFFQGNEGGVNVAPGLIGITPRIAQVQPYGVEVDPKLLEVAPRILTVKPIGVNIQPLDIQVSPVFIAISPKVNYYHPAVPGVPGSGK